MMIYTNTYRYGECLHFSVNAKHPDAQHIKAGNKVAFTYKGKSYYLNIVNTDKTEQTITATAWSLSFELINEDAGEYKAGKAMSLKSTSPSLMLRERLNWDSMRCRTNGSPTNGQVQRPY